MAPPLLAFRLSHLSQSSESFPENRQVLLSAEAKPVLVTYTTRTRYAVLGSAERLVDYRLADAPMHTGRVDKYKIACLDPQTILRSRGTFL